MEYSSPTSAYASTTYYIGSSNMEIRGTAEFTYLYDPSGAPFAIHKKTGETGEIYYLHLDHLGSIVAISDEQGGIVEKRSYDAWGRHRHPNTWDYLVMNPFGMGGANDITLRGYTFHEHLPHFSLINMNGRLYDYVLGRMLSPDNYVQSPDNTQSFNRYSYCWNNPLKYTDPSGEIITWNIGKGGLSVGLNFTPGAVPLGFGINIGWANGGSVGIYGEVGYRVGGTGFGKGATVSQSLDYNFKQGDLSTTSSANAYTSFGAFNTGASYSKTYSLKNKQWSEGNWSVSAGLGVGTKRSGLGFNVSYGSGGWSYGMGGYYDKTAPSPFAYTKIMETEVGNEEIITACEGCPPEQKRKEAASSLAGVALVAVVEPSFFGEIALAAYGSYLILVYGHEVVNDAITYMQRKGERGQTAKPSGTNNPYKHLRERSPSGETKPGFLFDPKMNNGKGGWRRPPVVD